jgi:hypothetical protein
MVQAIIYQDHSASSSDRVLRYSSTQGHSSFDANATIPTEFAGQLLDREELEHLDDSAIGGQNSTKEVEAPHAVVEVKCSAQLQSKDIRMESKLPYRKDDGQTTGVLPELRTLLKKVSDAHVFATKSRGTLDGGAIALLGPIYIPSPEPGSRSSIVILVSGEGTNMSTIIPELQQEVLSWVLTQLSLKERRMSFQVEVCTISSYWNTGVIQLNSNEGLRGLIKTRMSSLSVKANSQQMTLDFANAGSLCSWNFTRLLLDNEPPSLANVLATLLSRMPPMERIPDFRYTSKPVSSSFPPYNLTITEYGFGYGTRSTSIYLAMAVISTYCAITISYTLYCIITGSVSTAWNSGIELFTLALQSRKPDHLGHTSVGMDSIISFSEGVGVRVNRYDELEIVFANDSDFGARELTKLNENKEY